MSACFACRFPIREVSTITVARSGSQQLAVDICGDCEEFLTGFIKKLHDGSTERHLPEPEVLPEFTSE